MCAWIFFLFFLYFVLYVGPVTGGGGLRVSTVTGGGGLRVSTVTGGGGLRVSKMGIKLQDKGKLGKFHVYSGNVHAC